MKYPETYGREFILLNYHDVNAEHALDLMNAFISGFRKGEEVKRKRKANKNTFQVIVDIVFEFYNLDPEIGKIKNRKREIVQARQISFYEGDRLTNLSYQSMADAFGQDHSTCTHAIKVVKNLIEYNPVIKREIYVIENRIAEKIKQES